MKYKLWILFTLLVYCNISLSQVINDDCVTATDIGLLPLSWDQDCADGTINWSIGILDSTIGATPSSPYFSMTGCNGYSSATTTLSDDVWFKFKNLTQSVEIHLIASDTVHINLYRGFNCSSLLPVGCWTSLNTVFQMGFYSSNDTLNEDNFIQVSGSSPGQQIHFALCIRTNALNNYPQYGNLVINTGIVDEHSNYFSEIRLSPNPALNDIKISNYLFPINLDYKIFNSIGREVQSGIIYDPSIISIRNLRAGVYVLLLEDKQKKNLKTFKFIIN